MRRVRQPPRTEPVLTRATSAVARDALPGHARPQPRQPSADPVWEPPGAQFLHPPPDALRERPEPQPRDGFPDPERDRPGPYAFFEPAETGWDLARPQPHVQPAETGWDLPAPQPHVQPEENGWDHAGPQPHVQPEDAAWEDGAPLSRPPEAFPPQSRPQAQAPAAEAPLAALRRDPAPSRAAYRLHRLWLTPLYRGLVRKGLPVFTIILCAGIWLQDDARRAGLAGWVEGIRQTVAERPEFMVQLLRIEGASEPTADQIRERLGLRLPLSSFELDLVAMHDAVLELDTVAQAKLAIRKGGILAVDVVERLPSVVWRSASGIGTLDATGHPVAPLLSRLERPDLPLIVGEGADAKVPEALEVLAVAGPLQGRVRGLVRVGLRRWDLIVEPAIRLMLPEDDPVSAFEQVIALHQAQALLDRDITAVDMRIPARPTVRLNGPAAETYRQTSAILPARREAKP